MVDVRHQDVASMISMDGTLNFYTVNLVLSSYIVIILIFLSLILFFACGYIYQTTHKVRKYDPAKKLLRPSGRHESVISPFISRFLHYGLPAFYHWKTGLILSALWFLFLFPGIWLISGNPGENLMSMYPFLFLISIILGFLNAHSLTFRILDRMFGNQYFTVVTRRMLLFTISIAGLMAGTGVLFFFDALQSATREFHSLFSGEALSLFAFFISAVFIGITPFSLTYEITHEHRDTFMV
jgi:hypothetical protein